MSRFTRTKAFLVLALALGLSLVSCGSSDDAGPDRSGGIGGDRDASSADIDASTCSTPDPSNSATGDYCVDGVGTICCGDVGWGFICTNGAWECPPGTIAAKSCTSHCLHPDAGDAGPSD